MSPPTSAPSPLRVTVRDHNTTVAAANLLATIGERVSGMHSSGPYVRTCRVQEVADLLYLLPGVWHVHHGNTRIETSGAHTLAGAA